MTFSFLLYLLFSSFALWSLHQAMRQPEPERPKRKDRWLPCIYKHEAYMVHYYEGDELAAWKHLTRMLKERDIERLIISAGPLSKYMDKPTE